MEDDDVKNLFLQAIEALEQIEIQYDKFIQSTDAGKAPETTVTAPELTTRRGEIETGGTAPFPPQQLAIIRKAFPSGTVDNLGSRLTKLTEVSNLFYQASTGDDKAIEQINKSPLSDTLNNVMLMDIFAMIVKDMDAGSSAYMFEYFLALMFEGKVTGKETTSKGKMAATDFVTKNKTRGSAKFYVQKKGIGQAIGGFPMNEPIYYVAGIKREDSSQFGVDTEMGKADPTRIVGVDIYSFVVTRVNETEVQFADGTTRKAKAGSVSLAEQINSNSYKGTVRLCASPTQSFSDLMDNSFRNTGKRIKQAYEELKLMTQSLRIAKESTKEYISSGDMNVGNNALGKIQTSENSFMKIISALSNEEGYGNVSNTTGKIQEIKSQDIDTLIAEAIRDIKKNNK